MAALGWLMNVGFAAGGTAFVPPPADDADVRRRHGVPKKPWWEKGWVLPPHKRIRPEDLPHTLAIEEAREDLRSVRRIRAAPPAELRKLAAQLGGIVRQANTLEARIEKATKASEVTEAYRSLQARIVDYTRELEDLKERRLKRLRADDEQLLNIIMEMD